MSTSASCSGARVEAKETRLRAGKRSDDHEVSILIRLGGDGRVGRAPQSRKETRQPKSVPPRFMGQDHAGDLPTRRCAPGLQTLDEGNQAVAKNIQNVSGMPANHHDGELSPPMMKGACG